MFPWKVYVLGYYSHALERFVWIPPEHPAHHWYKPAVIMALLEVIKTAYEQS